MRRSILLFFVLTACLDMYAQSPSGDLNDVKSTISKLFKGMYDGDSAVVHSAFVDNPTMATIFRNKNTGQPTIVRDESLNDFLKSVGTKHPEPYAEEIWNVSVQVDGDFAQAWCDYAFYVGNKFSHCGVDAFNLFRTADGWKIFHIADTRRREGCTVPQDIQDKHK